MYYTLMVIGVVIVLGLIVVGAVILTIRNSAKEMDWEFFTEMVDRQQKIIDLLEDDSEEPIWTYSSGRVLINNIWKSYLELFKLFPKRARAIYQAKLARISGLKQTADIFEYKEGRPNSV